MLRDVGQSSWRSHVIQVQQVVSLFSEKSPLPAVLVERQPGAKGVGSAVAVATSH